MGLPGDTCGFEPLARYAAAAVPPMMLMQPKEGGGRMRQYARNWRHLLYVSATLATFLLAAGAKFKNGH
jgi:hypothetical protein